MAGCDKKSRTQQISCNKRSGYEIWTNHAGAGRAWEGGKARVTEKRGKKLLCASSVQWILHLDVFHFYARTKRVN